MGKFLTLDDIEVESRTVIIRVDINVPYNPITGNLSESERIRAHAKTIRELSEREAKVVIIAHQGRKGESDFIHLDKHAQMLSKYLNKPVTFVDDIVGSKARKSIKNLNQGEILLLDNVRFLDDETMDIPSSDHVNSTIVKALAPLGDIFVNDAFSVAHRSHASIVGFTSLLSSVAGRVMERELKACKKALTPKRPNIYLLGGAKPKDCITIMKHILSNDISDKVLFSGLAGQLSLMAKGVDLGFENRAYLKKKKVLSLVSEIEDVDKKYKDKIEVPLDVAVDDNGLRREVKIEDLPSSNLIMDIGSETIERYSDIVRNAKTIVVKGPSGVYEKKGFEMGTFQLLNSISKTQAFTLIGGGDTSVAVEYLGFDKSSFSYVSIAGGALITFLSGKRMPGIEALMQQN
jgi:phosphoglycerate kinase